MTASCLRAPIVVLALMAAFVAALGAGPANASPAATATACNVSSVATRLGPTSVSSLTVKGVSCAEGIAVVKAFHACRMAHGKTGRCVKLVKGGYACREQRTNAPTEIDGTVVCAKGSSKVSHHYRQLL